MPISTNQGSPVVELEPRSGAARALAQFSERFVGRPIAADDPPTGRWLSRKGAS